MLDLDSIHDFHRREQRRLLAPLITPEMDADKALSLLEGQNREKVTFSLAGVALDRAARAALLGRLEGDAAYTEFAAALAEQIVRRYLQPAGTFFEYDRASWLREDELWRTIPWGTAFRGNALLDVFHHLQTTSPLDSLAWWRDSLHKIGNWIYGNSIVGSFVFNCTIDLCRLLWRIGNELNEPGWMRWAIEAGRERIRRDVDEEGFIQGENGGCSGVYQLVGAEKLALFAWQSRDDFLKETLQRVFGALVQITTPTLWCPANYGTRSSVLKRIPSEIILVMAAEGNEVAAGWLHEHGHPAWSRDFQLWKAALQNQQMSAPEYSGVTHLRGIETTVVREGDFIAYFCNYDRSLWARGFCNLWHSATNDFLFATLHSLDTRVEKSKLLLGDTSDWAGFPHVRVLADDMNFHSQQQIQSIATSQDEEGVTVRWEEYLMHPEKGQGAVMRLTYRFKGERLTMRIELADMAGVGRLDFHLLRRPESFIGFWKGEAVEQITQGILPAHGGWHHDQIFSPGDTKAAIQIDNAVFVFEVIAAPPEYSLSLGHLQNDGLHTNTLAGARLRLEGSSSADTQVFEVSFAHVKGYCPLKSA